MKPTDPAPAPKPDALALTCPCGQAITVPKSLAGGLTNCPRCNQVVQVPGGPEPLFWVLVGGGVFATALVAAVLGVLAGPVAGGIAAVVGLAIVGIVILAS